MLTKTKKKMVKIQKSKIFKNGKNGLEMWIATFPQNLALICLMVCEKMRFTDAMALGLLTQSSRAKKQKFGNTNFD